APEDPDAWLARCPVVEADPSDESLRRALLGTVEHEIMREMIMGAPLKGIEQFVVGDDAVAYEEWFAKQPKPHFPPMDLPESYKADILHVTRDNPPWARGEYLGYYRPPVPRHLFDADMGPLDEDDAPVLELSPACTPEPEPAIESTPDLKTRIARLLDRQAPRLPEELDLAEAICAVKWPKWPAYQGSVDLVRLRDVLKGVRIDAAALNWLGGREIQKRCREAARAQP
ncbi:MAG: hypothetical protein WAS21_06145, partial [Geminicoccaceae bacterium]